MPLTLHRKAERGRSAIDHVETISLSFTHVRLIVLLPLERFLPMPRLHDLGRKRADDDPIDELGHEGGEDE